MITAMLRDPLALIARKERWKDYHLLGLKTPQISRQAQPGQFLMVRVNDQSYPLLRRPFSIHARNENTVEIFFSRAGIGTTILADKKEGETLDVLGPLGKGFTFKKSLQKKTVFLVGGGRGIAPLYFLAQELRAREIRPRIFYGGKTEPDLPVLEKFHQEGFDVFVSTDDGSLGFKGLVSRLLQKELLRSPALPPQIYACGPEPMMEAVASLARARHIPAQFSLESIMGCGIGACWGCVKRIRRGAQAEWTKICEEGPVFRGADIIWEGEDS
jgi:dihydroorotate dehydrogenase electron transfer subunit